MRLLVFGISSALALASCATASAQTTDPVAECHRLAAIAEDEGHLAEPVWFPQMDSAVAASACQAAVNANPDDARLLTQLGRALAGEKRGPEAAAALQKAADKGFAPAWTTLGELYEYGDGVEADPAHAAELYRKGGEAGSMMSLHSLAYLHDLGSGVTQDYAEAARLHLQVVGSGADPAFSYSARHLSDYFVHGLGVSRDAAESERLLRLSLTTKDVIGFARAQAALAWRLSVRNEKLDEAEQLARASVASAETTGDELGNRLDTLAHVLWRQGKNDEALETVQKAIGLVDDNAFFFDHLGDINAALGRKDEAKTAWTRALEMGKPTGVFGYDFDADAIRSKLSG